MATLLVLIGLALGAPPDVVVEIDALQNEGRFAEAVERGATALDEAEARDGADSLEVARIAFALGTLHRVQGNYGEVAGLFLRALAIREAALGRDHVDVAEILMGLGEAAFVVGDYAGARGHFERSLAIREAQLDPLDPHLAATVANLAGALHMDSDWDGAEARYREALALLERIHGDAHPDVAGALGNLGVLYRDRGDLDSAEAAFQRAFAIVTGALPPDHPDTATAHDNLGKIAAMRGQEAEATAHTEAALAILEGALAPGHPDVARMQLRLAGHYQTDWRLEEARALLTVALTTAREAYGPASEQAALILLARAELEQRDGDGVAAVAQATEAVRVIAQVRGPLHPSLGDAHHQLGRILRKRGALVPARRNLERALAIKESHFGEAHMVVISTLAELGGLAVEAGDAEGGLVLLERALEVLRSTPEHNPRHASILLGNLALAAEDLGDRDRAEALYDEALAIAVEVDGPDAPLTASALSNRALFSIDSPEGLALLEQALAIFERVHGPRHHWTLRTRIHHGVALRQRDLEQSRELLRRACEDVEAVNGPRHPDLAVCLANLAGTLRRLDAREEAREAARRSADIALGSMAPLLGTVSEREALAAVGRHGVTLEIAVGVLDRPEDAEEAWNAVLKWKGAVARAVSLRRSRTDADDPARVELRRLRHQEAAILFGSGSGDALQDLAAQREKLERQVGRGDTEFQAELARRTASARDVCAALPEGAVLVDLYRFVDLDQPKYAAFIADGTCAIRRVDLEDATAVDAAVAAHRAALSQPDTPTERVDRRGLAVRQLVWDPLGIDSERVLLVPDAALTGVSFAALPTGDGYLVESVALSYLESATDLLRWVAAAPASEGLLLVGGLDYGEEQAEVSRNVPCLDEAVPQLPGSASEVDAIGRLWRQRARVPADRLTGGEATEGELGDRLGRYGIAHLATHGFFATEQCRSALDGGGHDPMLLSGLLVSGVNAPGEAHVAGDGVLTAAEVSGLELGGVRLVVLSACETGLGEVQSGQGVLGLRRAFAASGVRSLVMSLWSVPDAETAVLMEAMYRSLLRRRKPEGPARALRQAQLALLDRNRRDGDARPASWAAFIAAGDPHGAR